MQNQESTGEGKREGEQIPRHENRLGHCGAAGETDNWTLWECLVNYTQESPSRRKRGELVYSSTVVSFARLPFTFEVPRDCVRSFTSETPHLKFLGRDMSHMW